ncbi:YitT family protein [uncultured Anaerococcus sp.]|uniref:YitT family protein n=1 Tax=uncultured Anaerococcus sp. TaxID=293428 RepID=UPI00260D5E98|nr:YitT family protein [uncultured Anaerococcus sp.]
MKKNVYIVLGSVILATGLYFFLIQHHIAAGGISGLSLVLSTIFKINIGFINLFLNVIVLILGAVLVSVNFTKRSVLSAATVSITIIIFESLFSDTILTNDMILNVIIGPIIVAIGLGLIFYNGGSSGGTDVIAAILNKYTNFPIHISLFLTDLSVIILSNVVIGLERSLYAVLAIIIQAISLDYVIQGLDRKIAVFIISDRYEEITNLLVHEYKRGVTLLHAEGGYTANEKKIVLAIINTRKYPLIREHILNLDDKAFMFSYSVSEVLGEGFTIKELR